jgi:hypothetical protein
MIRINESLHIQCPTEEVFGFLTLAENFPRWQEGIVSIQVLDAGPWRPGTRIRTIHSFLLWKRLQDDSEITGMDPGRGFTNRGKVGNTRYEEAFSLQAHVGGTTLDYQTEIRAGDVFRFFEPVAGYAFKMQMKKSFGKLKRLLEKTSP